MNEQSTSEIPQELHELNIAQGKINRLIEDWHELSEEERIEQMEQSISILEYPVRRLSGCDE
jgi:hypothetical protein